MAIKVEKTKSGHFIIPLSRADVIRLFGGFGICDDCGQTDETGFLVPVMGHKWFCRKCLREWQDSEPENYPEDREYEKRVLQEMRQIVGA